MRGVGARGRPDAGSTDRARSGNVFFY